MTEARGTMQHTDTKGTMQVATQARLCRGIRNRRAHRPQQRPAAEQDQQAPDQGLGPGAEELDVDEVLGPESQETESTY